MSLLSEAGSLSGAMENLFMKEKKKRRRKAGSLSGPAFFPEKTQSIR
jgi:hypothetical protein